MLLLLLIWLILLIVLLLLLFSTGLFSIFSNSNNDPKLESSLSFASSKLNISFTKAVYIEMKANGIEINLLKVMSIFMIPPINAIKSITLIYFLFLIK